MNIKPSHINLTYLHVLVALAEGDSFSEAGRILGLTQSAVSHSLARLESELGVVLVERGRRGVTLTDAGQQVLEHAREVTARVEAIRELAGAGEATGKLRIGLASPLPARLTAGFAARFKRAYPGIELMLAAMETAEIAVKLAEGPLDLGFVANPPPKTAKELQFRLVMRDELCVVVALSHAFSNRDSVEITDLYSETVLVPNAGRERLIEVLRDPKGRSETRHFISDAQTLLAAAREGVGVSLMPRSLLPASPDALAVESLVALPCSPLLPWEVGLVARSWDGGSQNAALFAQVAEEWAKDNGLMPARAQ